MKKISLLLLLLMCAGKALLAQDAFDPKEPLTWLGLDFSSLKFVKSDETITEDELQNKYFPGWNDLILNEPKKYDLVKVTDHDDVSNYTDAVTAVNKNPGSFITHDAAEYEHLDLSEIKQIVKKYNLKGKTGLGLVFIMEGMDKGRESASIWVTYINMATKEVLLSKQMTGKSGGFGFRNYWASAIYKVMKAIPSYRPQWKKGK